ncbi:MAG: coproporphyrinogen dehydrogenase HemZ, partial [Peptococcaceae bacterium]|nr:coproporphyrinogen dehydrogenase HemZ [Peptococcaceae bacterium]
AYCYFPAFSLPKPKLQEEYLTNLLRECQAVGEALKNSGRQIQTVYIGGGTPTSLSEPQLARLLEGVQRYLGGESLAEFTVEAGRPDTITREKLQILHDYKAGRISINPQSFLQKTLDAIGRRHSVDAIYEVYDMARQVGFDSINMDLITGLTGETEDDFAYSLEQIARLKPENVTVHTLAIKRTARLALNQFSDAQSRIVEAMHKRMNQWLGGTGYVPYYLYRQKHMIGDQENTGYCLPGKESLYNILMMEERQTIFGLGVGSTSKYVNTADWTLTQSSNPKDLIFYNQRIDEIIDKKIEKIREMGKTDH